MREPILVEFLRDRSVESTHLIDGVILDAKGEIVREFGDCRQPIYARSMIKPIQAIPFVESGAPKQAPNETKAVAISCASHSSEHIHVDFLKEWHARLGIDTEKTLACGPQKPDDETVFLEIVRAHEKPKRINNNCSGKHTGMIATAIARGIDWRGYERWDHPTQKEIRKHLTKYSGVNHDEAPWGIDGCGIPTYFIPQLNVARMMSAMLKPELAPMREAFAKEPYMTGGHEWLDTEINASTKGRVFSKVGAEGNYAAVVYDQGLTILLKARDGNTRGTEVALYALLEPYLKNEERESLRALAHPTIKNWSGTVVGSTRVSL